MEDIDLFDYEDLQPANVRAILWDFGMTFSYEDCDVLIQKLNTVGYTCSYGLDASPYGLSKLQTINN